MLGGGAVYKTKKSRLFFSIMLLPLLLFRAVGGFMVGSGSGVEPYRMVRGCHRLARLLSGSRLQPPSFPSTSFSSPLLLMSSLTDMEALPVLGRPICRYEKVTVPNSNGDMTTQDNNDKDDSDRQQPRRENTDEVSDNGADDDDDDSDQQTATTTAAAAATTIVVHDITALVQERLESSGMQQGVIHVLSRHTTTAITVNERETRLARDMQNFFLALVPPDERLVTATTTSSTTPSRGTTPPTSWRYQHNDLDQRPESQAEAQRCRENGWDIDDPLTLLAWRAQEPLNAHSHLLAMLLGSSETIPVVNGQLVLGTWQSILLVDLDPPTSSPQTGPTSQPPPQRPPRTVGLQFLGYDAVRPGLNQ